MAQTLVLPGDAVPLPSTSALTLGPGIASSSRSTQYISTKLGLVSSSKGKEKASGWIETSTKRDQTCLRVRSSDTGQSALQSGLTESQYTPSTRDIVIGSIVARHSEGYRVDLGAAQMAQLDALAFEGATKRSKPNLKVGTLVFARVSLANRDMDPELECVDPATGKAEGFGELKGGTVMDCSLNLCRRLLDPKFPLLPTLASIVPYEIVIGLNGRIWLKTASVSETIALRRVLEYVNDGGDGQDKAHIQSLLKGYL